MASSSNRKKQTLLLVLLAVVTLLVARQYLPMIKLPTDALIREEEQQLRSKEGDLKVLRKMNEDWEKKLEDLRNKAGIFWIRTRPGMPVEQEVMEEFNNVARLASVNIHTKEPKLRKVTSSVYVQEVDIRMEMKGVSMKEFSRLLKQIDRNRRKFHWTSCRIDPDNLQHPTGIRVSATLTAYVLTEDGNRILTNSPALRQTSQKTSSKGQKI